MKGLYYEKNYLEIMINYILTAKTPRENVVHQINFINLGPIKKFIAMETKI